MKKIILELELEKVNTILAALGNMPYAQVAPLIEEIRVSSIPQLTVVETDEQHKSK
jgi:hypothetical protein